MTEETGAGSGLPCGGDPEEHVSALREFADAGFDVVHVNRIGPDPRSFLDFCRSDVLPRLRD